ncbi:MAG TPA: HAD family hydrolase [Chromatiales bacterium]|nr:HAD family hydrolase [Thiotrichales bacterium]HIP68681.1 HAD family hydrolase [Chromatiales bacterium]
MVNKTLFALDFDGVICDSAVETAITAWKAAQEIWTDMENQPIADTQIQAFRELRPRLEFGYEAILIMRLLQQETDTTELARHYHLHLDTLINDDDLSIDALKDAFGQTRDRQIQKNETTWIGSNPLFTGIAEKLKTLEQNDWFIITTKQERFVKRILQGNDIHLDAARVYGLDRKLDKQTVLKQLKASHPERPITFVEDRLPTLFGVLENPDLQKIKVQLADWGYNTAAERKVAQDRKIEVIGKEQFLRR